jgi:hypothetical protein
MCHDYLSAHAADGGCMTPGCGCKIVHSQFVMTERGLMIGEKQPQPPQPPQPPPQEQVPASKPAPESDINLTTPDMHEYADADPVVEPMPNIEGVNITLIEGIGFGFADVMDENGASKMLALRITVPGVNEAGELVMNVETFACTAKMIPILREHLEWMEPQARADGLLG